MRISINLATRPFLELRPLLARLRLVMLALAVLAAGLFFWLQSLEKRAAAAQSQMNTLKGQTEVYLNERARNEARMRLPANKAVLDRSTFLNELFARKSFSWTATMMDLERVLPAGVQVTSIDPVITKEGEVNIRLRVSGDRDRAIQLVRNLEHSQRFVGPRLAAETAISKERATALGAPGVQNVSAAAGGQPGGAALGGGVEFEIFSGYNPLPAASLADAQAAGAVPQAPAPQASGAQASGAQAAGAQAPGQVDPAAIPNGYAGHTRRPAVLAPGASAGVSSASATARSATPLTRPAPAAPTRLVPSQAGGQR